MRLETFIRNFSLKAIAFLVTLIVLWSLVLFVAVSFDWKFLTSKFEMMFVLSGFISGILFLSLTIANITSNLTIISMVQNKEKFASKKIQKQILFMIAGSVLFIGLLLGGMWSSWQQTQKKMLEEMCQKVEKISEKKLFDRFAREVESNGKISDILEIRDALANDITSKGNLFFLIPKKLSDVKVYYSITRWISYSDKKGKLSDAVLDKFKPEWTEKEKFDKLAKGEIDSFEVSDENGGVRVFLSKKIENQEIVIVLESSGFRNHY